MPNPDSRRISFGPIGGLGTGEIGAYPQIFIDLQIADRLNTFFRSLEFRVDEETLAEELIRSVGPGGSFLTEEHTSRLFREEMWLPRVFRKEHRHTYSAADPALEEAIRMSREYLTKEPPPPDDPLTPEQQAEIDRIVRTAEKSQKT